MFTPGGSHSEVEIPEILDHLRPEYPEVEPRYAWPFDLKLVAHTLTEQGESIFLNRTVRCICMTTDKNYMCRGCILAFATSTMGIRTFEL
jgi:hypothetical protein